MPANAAPITDLASQLLRDEGEVLHAYVCSEGFLTIGCGRLIDKRSPGAGISRAESALLLANDLAAKGAELAAALPWATRLDPVRYAVLRNMAHQMGVPRLLAFKQALMLLKSGRFEDAAREMLNSKWAQQTPARAHRLSVQLRTGQWQ